MRRRDRPIPFPPGSDAYRQEMARIRAQGTGWRVARQLVRIANCLARWTPLEGEKCLARNRKDGQPCQAGALPSGRCKWHGGMSTGPRTETGKLKALAAIGQKLRPKWPPPPHLLAARERREATERVAITHARD